MTTHIHVHTHTHWYRELCFQFWCWLVACVLTSLCHCGSFRRIWSCLLGGCYSNLFIIMIKILFNDNQACRTMNILNVAIMQWILLITAGRFAGDNCRYIDDLVPHAEGTGRSTYQWIPSHEVVLAGGGDYLIGSVTSGIVPGENSWIPSYTFILAATLAPNGGNSK